MKRDFVNAWVLAKDLEAIAAETSSAAVRAAAELVGRSYLYPVDSQVLSSEGKLLDHVCANDLHGEDDLQRYLALLDSARCAPAGE